ncbi:MAG: hypothetical protein FD155_2097 [Bacteroidetes bacterium]|nr:MAG: hypothetical protein FD155_2097 [Bacteroidota bacterium]
MEIEWIGMDEFETYLNTLYWEQALDDLPTDLVEFEYQRFRGESTGSFEPFYIQKSA